MCDHGRCDERFKYCDIAGQIYIYIYIYIYIWLYETCLHILLLLNKVNSRNRAISLILLQFDGYAVARYIARHFVFCQATLSREKK